MAYKVTDTVVVDQNRNLSSIGIATFAGPLLIGGGSSTGTVSQPLQVLGTNGAYIGGNLGIGSTNPSSKLSVIGDATFSGIVTSSGLNVRKDPGTGIATDFTNSLFGNGWRLSAPGSTTYYLLATLPAGGGGNTFDHLRIEGTLGAWINDNQTPFDISFSNRGTFDYKYISYGSIRSDVRIVGISTNSTIQIWAQHQASVFTKLVYNITQSIQAIVVSNPTSTTTAPVGTTVFDSSTVTPRFIINESDNIGIGTTNPQAKLQVFGDTQVDGNIRVGISTTSNYIAFRGTNLDDQTLYTHTFIGERLYNTFESSELLFFKGNDIDNASGPDRIRLVAAELRFDTIDTGTLGTFEQVATSANVTNKMILTGAGNLGIGTTNPTSKLWVDGNGYFTGIVTANRIFSGVYGEFTGGSISGTNLVGTALSVSGISTFSNGPVFIGSETSTGTASQPLQVTGGGYFSQSVGIGTTNPTSTLQVQGTVSVSSTTTSSEFVGGGSDLRNLSGTHLVSYASASDISNSALSIAGISTYNQVGILTGSLAVDASDTFGYSVATSADGKTIVVGAYFDEIGANNASGVVYVYDRVGSSFNQVGILTGSLAVDNSDTFGYSVATSADGKTIVVGARQDELSGSGNYGLAYVFDRVGSSFNQVGILTGSLAVDPDNFGQSVATSADGKTIIVGARQDELSGSGNYGLAYVFDRVGSSFNQVGILTGSLAVSIDDGFGQSVATSADGKTIVVSAYQDEIGATTNTGVVYVFDRVGNSFNQVGILTGSLADDNSDSFGYSVATSADGKTIVVGAQQDEIGATAGTGVVYVFDRVGNSFNQVGILTGSLAVDASDAFGWSVATSADGKTIVVGAYQDEIGATTGTGIAYVFNRQGNSFNQVGILTGSLAVDGNDSFGYSVATSADGKTIVVGAYFDEIGATTSTGVVYVFDQTRQTYVHSGPTGNIGIGTALPTSALTVQGNALITGVATVTSNFTVNGTATVDTSVAVGSGVTITSNGIQVTGIVTASQLDLTASATANDSVLYLSGTPTSSSGTNGLLGIGALNFSDTDIIADFTHSVNSYAQLVVQNKNSGSTASADIIVNNDRTGGTSYYGDFGVNSTTFSGVGPFNDPDGVYVISSNGSLTLGSITLNPVKVATNNVERLRVTETGNVGIGTTLPAYPLQVQGDARITGAFRDSTNSPGTSGQVLQSTVTGTQWATAAAGGSGKFDTAIDNVLYVQPTGTLDIVGVGTTTSQITTLPSGSTKYLVHSIHVTNISNGDAEITAGFVMNARKVPATISVSIGQSGGPGIHTFTVGSASSITVGMAVTGTGNIGETTGIGTTAGFQFNTYVTSVDGNNITLSKPMSGRATGVLQFSPVSLISSRLPVPVGSAVELLKQPMVLNAFDSIVLQSTGAGTGIGTTSTNTITYTSGSSVLTVTNQAASFFNSIAIGNLVQNTGASGGIQTNTYVGASYTGITTSYAGTGVVSIPITRPVNATVGVATALSFTEVVTPQDGALQVTVVYQSSTDTSYQNGTGTVVAISSNTTSVTAGLSTIPVAYYSTGIVYPSIIQSIRVSNISDGIIYPGGDYPVSVGIGNSDTIFSWLAYNMVIPRNSSIELCEAPKRIGIGQSIFAFSNTPYAIEIQIAGKQKTS